MKISVLAENTAVSEQFDCEHGLSLYIEVNDAKILFDFGQSKLFAENAQKLGIDLSAVEFAVLSHGHYDHGNGMKYFMRLNDQAPVYVNEHAFGEYYNASNSYIGLDYSLRDEYAVPDGKTNGNEGRLVTVGDSHTLTDNMVLYTCNDRPRTQFAPKSGLGKMIGGVRVQDDFMHEQYLLIEENGRRILISGCSHKGILNLCNWFRPDICVGGFHFMKLATDAAGSEILGRIAEELLTYPTRFYTCHCTGEKQFELLKEHMGNRLYALKSGMQMII